jgi:uncharacterized protein (TIGR01244 family)
MNNARYLLTLIILCFAITACQVQEHAAIESHTNFNTPEKNLVTGGQPTAADLVQLKKMGITKVINLRAPSEEISFDEKATAESLGLEYVSLPINGATDITSENARKLQVLLQDEDKVFVHCASGNRVGALVAIRAHEIENKSEEESLRVGRAAGLGQLEGTVKSHLTK